MKIIAFVPIKLNSQRLPGKNLLPLMGKPMCYHLFATLLKSKYISRVYVFCSNESIMQHIPSEVNFLKRPDRLDRDEVKGMEIYQEFIKTIHSDIYVLGHVTSPFLTIKSIDSSLEKILWENYDSAFSARMIKTFVWYNNKPLNYDLNNPPRTQDISPILVETSGFYIFQNSVIKRNRRIGFKPWIQVVDSIEGIDIDEKEDYEFALKFDGIEKI